MDDARREKLGVLYFYRIILMSPAANSTGIFLRRKVPDSINTCLFAIRLLLILIREK